MNIRSTDHAGSDHPGKAKPVVKPNTQSDEQAFENLLRSAIEEANVPTLQVLTVQLTGDRKWIEEPFLPTRPRGIDDNDSGGFPDELQQQVRQAAYDSIVAWHQGKPMAIERPTAEQIVQFMSVTMGESIPDAYGPFMESKMDAYTGRAKSAVSTKVPSGFKVTIVGAGMSGICAGVRLTQAGIPFTIIEKGANVGGVWRQNKYPGCGVDTPSHLYSYSFAQGDWSRYFAAKDEIEGYFDRVARELGVFEHIQFETEVIDTRYDEDRQRWIADLRSTDGAVESLESNVLIAAVGAFGTPKWPNIEGINSFGGDLMHTAQWDESVDLAGKRVAVIGNGASAMQLVPAIADRVDTLTVFQRSKQWAAPFPKLHKPIPDPVRFLLKEVPHYEWWYRLRLSWIFDSKVYESLKVDPEWTEPDHSLNAINDGHRRFFTRYIREQLGDREDLAEKVIPEFPPYGKRMLLDNGWFRTLTKPNVELVTTPIGRITEDGIETADDERYDFDAVIMASGFDVARFLAPVSVHGRNGVSIREVWGDEDPRAYLGTVTPGFPNFFTLYGPNTALGHGGSFIFVVECQVNYVLSVLDEMFASGVSEVECREDVCARYNETMEDMHSRMIWTHPGMRSYLQNSHGRVVMNSPWRTTDYWQMTRQADLGDFETKSPIVEAQVSASR